MSISCSLTKVIDTAGAQLARSDTAEMRVYARIGWNLKARVYLLRGENRNVARASIASRAEMLRVLELDPQMSDATTVLEIYNYSPPIEIPRASPARQLNSRGVSATDPRWTQKDIQTRKRATH
jgi:hypothetical protein